MFETEMRTTQVFMDFFRSIRHDISRQAVREVLLAAHGKKVSRLCIHETQIPWLTRVLEEAGLWVDLYHHKQVLAPDYGKGGWISGYGLEVPVDSLLSGYVLMYIGTNPDKVLAAKKAEHSHNYGEFGSLLGYPPCCIDFYEAHLARAESEQGDFVLPLLEQSTHTLSEKAVTFPYWTNVAAQYFDYGLLSFYPCSFFCKAAMQQAQEAWSLIQAYDHELAEAYLIAAKMPILYTEYEGVFAFRNAHLEGNMLSYDKEAVECTMNGVIAAILGQADIVKIHSNQSIDILNGTSLVAHLESSRFGMLLFA